MKPGQLFFIPVICLLLLTCQKPLVNIAEKTGILKITFVNTVKSNPVGLGSTVHNNPFGEQYIITKLKYYISNISIYFTGISYENEKDSYHLIDESNSSSLSFSFAAKVNKYNTLQFLLGVDSIRNVSGAQSGALDPLNDMFWTWNSGYVMAKMEATSPQSAQVNNKVEYHIGGFSGTNSVLKNAGFIMLGSTIIDIREGKTTEIILEADIDKWWQNPNDIKIAVTPVCNTPGPLAKSIADNYSHMFTVKSVINN
jgi:hypothetical protein